MPRRLLVALCCAVTSSALLLLQPGRAAAAASCPFSPEVGSCTTFCNSNVTQQCNVQYGHFGCTASGGTCEYNLTMCAQVDTAQGGCCDPQTGGGCDVNYNYCTYNYLDCTFY